MFVQFSKRPETSSSSVIPKSDLGLDIGSLNNRVVSTYAGFISVSRNLSVDESLVVGGVDISNDHQLLVTAKSDAQTSSEKLLEIGEASNTASLATSAVDESREEDVVKLSALLDAHTENKAEITLLPESVYDGNHIEQTINMVGIWGSQEVAFPLHLSIRGFVVTLALGPPHMSFPATSAGTIVSVTGMNARFLPVYELTCPIGVVSNGVLLQGALRLETNGNITCFMPNFGTFPLSALASGLSSGTKVVYISAELAA